MSGSAVCRLQNMNDKWRSRCIILVIGDGGHAALHKGFDADAARSRPTTAFIARHWKLVSRDGKTIPADGSPVASRCSIYYRVRYLL
jgi:hypothetical protein